MMRNIRTFDTRWITMPILATIALVSGANPWVVLLAFTAGFTFYVKY